MLAQVRVNARRRKSCPAGDLLVGLVVGKSRTCASEKC